MTKTTLTTLRYRCELKRTYQFWLWLSVFLLALISTTSIVSAQAADAPPEINLTQAIQTALANNTAIKQALLSVKDADQQVRSAWGNVMPSVSSSINYTRNLEIPVQYVAASVFDPEASDDEMMEISFSTDNSWSGGISASQILFSGQAFVGISASELYKLVQTEAFRATAQGIVTQTRVVYYQALFARKQVQMIEAEMNRVEQNLADTKKRYEQGFTDDYAVLQLEVQLANLKPQHSNAEYALANTKRDLLDVLGLPLELPISVVGDLNTFDLYADDASDAANEELKTVDLAIPLASEKSDLLLGDAFLHRGDLRILDIQTQLQNKQLLAQRTQYLPTVAANYNLQWTANQAGDPVFFGTKNLNRSRAQMLGLSVQLPIFSGFQRDASIQQTKIQLKNLALEQEQSQKTAQKEVITAQQSIELAYQNQHATAKALDRATVGYQRALARKKAGVGSQQEVTDANLQLQQAEIGYAQTILGYLVAKAQYDQAIGQVPFVDDIKAIQTNIDLK